MDMEPLLRLMASVEIVSSARPLLRVRVVLSKTTLVSAWTWGLFAACFWTATWLLTDVFFLVPAALAQQLWFASAVLVLSPFVAALGARRPVARVWSWFVVLPVMVVLLLPAVTAWNRDLRPAELRLEAPMLTAYALVLLMGLGNYVGTRFAMPALFVGAACVVVVWPLSGLAAGSGFAGPVAHAAATIGLALAAWLAGWQAERLNRSRSTERTAPLVRVWTDFRDFFGIVWARRLLDRVHEAAAEQNWPLRLRLAGFVPA